MGRRLKKEDEKKKLDHEQNEEINNRTVQMQVERNKKKKKNENPVDWKMLNMKSIPELLPLTRRRRSGTAWQRMGRWVDRCIRSLLSTLYSHLLRTAKAQGGKE